MAKKCWLDDIPVILTFEINGKEVTKQEYMEWRKVRLDEHMKKHFPYESKTSSSKKMSIKRGLP